MDSEHYALPSLLAEVNVNNYTEKKNGFTYLSWAHAWGEFLKICPDATYVIKKDEESKLPLFGNDDIGFMVFTEITANGLTHEMWLPIMDFRNQAIRGGKLTVMEINKAVMRCLVKNISMFGLGLYIYAGEDLPEESDGNNKEVAKPAAKPVAKPKPKPVPPPPQKTTEKPTGTEKKQKPATIIPDPKAKARPLTPMEVRQVLTAFDTKAGVEVWDLEKIEWVGASDVWTTETKKELLVAFNQLIKNPEYSKEDFLSGKRID